MESTGEKPAKQALDWRSVHGDMCDDQWALVADLVDPNWNLGDIGRPVEVDRSSVLDGNLPHHCNWFSVAQPSRQIPQLEHRASLAPEVVP